MCRTPTRRLSDIIGYPVLSLTHNFVPVNPITFKLARSSTARPFHLGFLPPLLLSFSFFYQKKKSDFQGHSVFFPNYPTTSFTSQRYNRGRLPKFKLNILHARPSYMRYFDPTHPELIECRYTGLGALRFISSARMCPTSARKRILFSSLRTSE